MRNHPPFRPSVVLLLVLLLVLLAPVGVHAQALEPGACVTHLEKARDVVQETWAFLIFKVGAHDLPGTVAALRADAEAATTPDACADVLDRFMASLRDGHANLIYFPGRTPRSAPDGLTLQTFRDRLRAPGQPRSGRVYVVEVDTARPALRSLPPGSQVLAVDGRPVSELARHVRERVSASTVWGRDQWTDRSLLLGPSGTSVALRVRTPAGEELELALERPAVPADDHVRNREAELYADTVTLVRGRRLEDGFGYIRLNSFGYTRAVKEFDDALDELRDAAGLVLDMRGNGGGRSDVMNDLVGRFFDKQVQVARYIIRHPGQEKVENRFDPWVARKRKWTFEAPVVLLVDAGCFSACDIFANAMDENGRALIIGPTPTGGGSASPVGERTSPEWDGVAIRASFLIATRQDGTHIESNGVRPHVMVEPSLSDVLARRDAPLERALVVLRQGKAPALAGR